MFISLGSNNGIVWTPEYFCTRTRSCETLLNGKVATLYDWSLRETLLGPILQSMGRSFADLLSFANLSLKNFERLRNPVEPLQESVGSPRAFFHSLWQSFVLAQSQEGGSSA